MYQSARVNIAKIEARIVRTATGFDPVQGALLVLSALRQYLDQPTAATSPAPEPVQRIDIS